MTDTKWTFAERAFARALEIYPELRSFRNLFQYGALWAYEELRMSEELSMKTCSFCDNPVDGVSVGSDGITLACADCMSEGEHA